MKKILLFLLISVGSVWGICDTSQEVGGERFNGTEKGEIVNIAFQNSVPFCVSAIQER